MPSAAMLYTLNRWKALLRNVEDGRLPPDRNAVENAIRGIAVSRRNGLLPTARARDVDALLPWHWPPTPASTPAESASAEVLALSA